MPYQIQAARLAPSASPTPVAAALQDALCDAVRRIRRAVPDLSLEERRLLDDLQRGRYQLVALARLLAMATRCTDDADAEALPEGLRALVVAARPRRAVPVDTAFDDEDDANSAFDKAQRAFERRRCPASRQQAIEAGHRQLVRTRTTLAAIEATPVLT